MYLTDLIKTLIEILADNGDCEVVVNTEHSDKSYRHIFFHYLPFDVPIIRLEGITDETYQNLKENNLAKGDDEDDEYEE